MQNQMNVVIAGAGLMGASIAQVFAQYGCNTVLYSRKKEDFDRARKIISNGQQTLVENGILTREQSIQVQDALRYTEDAACFEEANLVIEAIPEVFEIKAEFFGMISERIPPDCIVATNTSAISVNDLAEHCSQPERFCGTHWLNPPHIIPLVEIVRGTKTAPWVVDTLRELLSKMGKQPVVLNGDIKGFLSNRLQFALLREASYLVESGIATPEDIDKTLKYGNGIRYCCSGPFRIVDLGGVGVFRNVARYLFPDLSTESQQCSLLEELAEQGYDGISTLKGFYQYSEESAQAEEQERDRKMLELLKL